jgi:TRAP-type C4-dicarboxylate transport system permease large subunit
MISAKMKPSIAPEPEAMGDMEPLTKSQVYSGLSIVFLIFMVLGGIWGGLFTATEAAGMGALFAMIIAYFKGLNFRQLAECTLDAGKTSAPIMILLIAAGMYSKFLSLADIHGIIVTALQSIGLEGLWILIFMAIIWLVLGMLLDSISIILLTVPLFITLSSGMDPYAFAIFGILAIEAGLLTPPFGLIVYTVKGVLAGSGDDVALKEIFAGSIPYWIMMLFVMILIVIFPEIASWLTNFV